MVPSSDSASRPKISICSFVKTETLTEQLEQALTDEQYAKIHFQTPETFFEAIEHDFHAIDCLILEQFPDLVEIINRLHRSAILLPAVILTLQTVPERSMTNAGDVSYHTAETYLDKNDLNLLPSTVESAIAKFLKLSPQCRLPLSDSLKEDHGASLTSELSKTISVQQQRLAGKIKERLGYLGIFYKRDPQHYFRHLSESERAKFLQELTEDYRDIILIYFQENSDVNQKIDAFVSKAFFADLSISQVLEVHMTLMEKLAKKLKIEGRNEDILLDYRLTLIDTVAHLCEMYRRSIPRKS